MSGEGVTPRGAYVTSKPILVDAFCCQGGATKGYQRAGFHVIGIDKDPQPRYCGDEFIQGDVLDVLPELLATRPVVALHGSPPCQAYTLCQRIQGNDHPDLVAPTRTLFEGSGLPWIIENVEGAPLIDPVLLCGSMFPELRVYRHRLFESSLPLVVPEHPEHVAPLRKMGRAPQPGDWMHVVGNFSGVAQAREAMGGVDWMNRDGLRESIPPAYAEWFGWQLRFALTRQAVAA